MRRSASSGSDLPQRARDLGVGDLAPRPELRQPAAFGGVGERQRDDPGPVADHALDLERAGERARPWRRAPAARRDRDRGAPPAWRPDDRPENVAVRLVTAGLSSLPNRVRMRSSTCSAEPIWVKVPRPSSAARVIRKRVGRGADADHEDARAPAHGADRLEQLLLVADLAVGEEDHLADVVGVAAAPVGQRRPHRRHHLGAAAGLERRHERLGLRDMLGVGRDRVGEQHVHGVVEADDVETVGRREPAERIEQARLGLHDRRAAHGAGIVDDEHDLARAPLFARPTTGGGVTKASR